MRIDILTLFPEMCERVLDESIIGRGRRAGYVDVRARGIRPYSTDKFGRTDRYPYGGNQGMLMMAQPIDACFASVVEEVGSKPHFIFMSPLGKTLTQDTVNRLAAYDNIAILCGHYEGVDRRIIDKLVDEEISLGDFVVTGGELPALVLADAICRLQPGVLDSEECYADESHYSGLLEYPQYTRPEVYDGMRVPKVLLSGDHEAVAAWQRVQSLEITARLRPDMLEKRPVTDEDKRLIKLWEKKRKLFEEDI